MYILTKFHMYYAQHSLLEVISCSKCRGDAYHLGTHQHSATFHPWKLLCDSQHNLEVLSENVWLLGHHSTDSCTCSPITVNDVLHTMKLFYCTLTCLDVEHCNRAVTRQQPVYFHSVLTQINCNTLPPGYGMIMHSK